MRPLLYLMTVFTLFSPVAARAQSCYSYGTTYYRPSNTYSTYYTPQKATYAPPVVYVAPVQKILIQEVYPLYIPVNAYTVPVQAYGVPYYYSAGEAYREKAYLRDVIREEFRGLLAAQSSSPPRGMAPSGVVPPAQREGPPLASRAPVPPADAPRMWVPDEVTPVDIQEKVLAAFRGRGGCVTCHGSTGTNKFRLTMDDGAGKEVLVRLTEDKRWKVYGMASVGAMPPAAAKDATKAMETEHLPHLLRYAAIRD